MPLDDLATLVDMSDIVIGSKPRRDITSTDIYRVAALWLSNSQGEVLLAKRSLNKRNNPGKWGPAAAGTVEPGETYEQNIYREVEEEIDLAGHKLIIGPKIFTNESGRRSHFTQWFTLLLDQPLSQFKIKQDEVEQIAWVPRTQVWRELATKPEKYIPGALKWPQLFQ